ncbi:MAG: T9SS type A sorting domain-containing protein [Bacteroidales bacterium]|nr:T9SS type A sorting domain-containing protein [Bacteroidales bacterium]
MKTNVYKLVLGFLITLFALNLNAQDYEYIPMVKPGVQIWTCDYIDCWEHYLFRRFALTDEDTLIDGDTYKKLYFFTSSIFNPLTAECVGGLRENEQKQFYYKGGDILGGMVKPGLIYDFSLSVGDTFSNDFYTNIIGFPLVLEVKNIDTVYYAGAQRREFEIGELSDTSSSPYIVAQLIEGIGNTQGLMFDMYLNFTLCQPQGRNRCYEHNGELLYHDNPSQDCITPLYGLNDMIKEDNSITLYPNPARKEVNISSESIINSIEVFNSLGQKVYQTDIKAKEKTLDINSFSKGVYIIGVNTDRGYIRKKLIKN